MKTAIALTSLAVLVGALSASTTVAATPDTSARGESSSACIELPGLPRATTPGESTLFGHISSLTVSGGRYLMKFDPAMWLTGLTAKRAALADTGSSDVPNDYYIVDETHRLYTYVVRRNAAVTILPGGRPCARRSNVASLAQLVKRGTQLGFWIRVSAKYPSAVESLDQQYQP